MRLDKIKLVGFKSFAEPTNIVFPKQLTGIVGPNGCGKSNIIDAIRWVMGESSAKQLRGESIADVIFNGSRDRKPVGQASIELVFNNEDGTLGGEYAQYNQISIKRLVDRDSQSTYFLNGTRCRRRDITDVFLGTGLGPRSYSIIEQGMISQVIEARPEELRSYLEEVAGISKYKERRRETENRIKHTRENLDRINDLREELGKQLEKLKRQARAAERYKVLKEEERLLRAQLLVLKWQSIENELKDYSLMLSKQETLLASYNADYQRLETEIEKQHTAKTEFNDEFNEIQGRYYQLGSDIAKLEQSIEHQKSHYKRLQDELDQTKIAWEQASTELKRDEALIHETAHEISELQPELNLSRQRSEASRLELTEAEQQIRNWQNDWDEFNTKAGEISRIAQVEQTRIQHFEEQQNNIQQQIEKIRKERETLQDLEAPQQLQILEKELESIQQLIRDEEEKLVTVIATANEQRQKNLASDQLLNTLRKKLQEVMSRHAALEALQQVALGKKEGKVVEWLENNQMAQYPRLAQALSVEPGWEKAIEIVLGRHLEAVCVENVDLVSDLLGNLSAGTVGFVEASTDVSTASGANLPLLKEKIKSKWDLGGVLDHIYVVDSLSQALDYRHQLLPHESLITQEGLWVGPHWLRISKHIQDEPGVIHREEELRHVQHEIHAIQTELETAETALEMGLQELSHLEKERESLQQALTHSKSTAADYKAQLQIQQSKIAQFNQRQTRLNEESLEQNERLEESLQELTRSKKRWEEALNSMDSDADHREQLLEKRDEYREIVERVRQRADTDKEHLHQLELRLLSRRGDLSSLEQTVQRTREHLLQLDQQQQKAMEELSNVDVPIDGLQDELQQALNTRIEIEHELAAAKQHMEAFEQAIQRLMSERREVEGTIQQSREILEAKRLKKQELTVRQTTFREQIKESSFEIETLVQEMPEEANESQWTESVETVTSRISRLGPINLAAIDEYEELSQRKNYLDAQNTDLEDALSTLLNAIHKIDRETRQRFRDTFDTVNSFFKEFFPKVFGGGSAYLELVGDDLLNAGVSLMAKPPGKHVSNIHQLSGGEKALVAIALVFSLFQLNPAPFCMLDEVDAPLDDTNVGRFCTLVKEMSNKVQFIFISHNKVAIEMANHLAGITMHEPGVSRVVAVDVDSAIEMVGTS